MSEGELATLALPNKTKYAGNWIIWTGVSITRRKSYHLVTDPEGLTVFRHRLFWPCVEYLDAIEEMRYLVLPSEHQKPASVRPLAITRTDQPWQK